MRRIAVIFTVLVVVLGLFWWTTWRVKGLHKESIVIQDRDRTYFVHVPYGYNGKTQLPLVLAFHGHLGTGEGMARLTHLNDLSDKHGFLVVYPDGYRRSWADGRGSSAADLKGVDDIGFVRQMIGRLQKEFYIDPHRIYAVGISNGGFFSERVACELSDRIAGIAVVAATFQEKLVSRCKPEHPVSVLLMMGTKDPLVPWNGGELKEHRGIVLSATESEKKWVELNGCNGAAEQQDPGPGVHAEIYPQCRENTEVAFYRIEGGGHTWPGGRQYLPEFFIGKTNRDIDASEVISDFFLKHSKQE